MVHPSQRSDRRRTRLLLAAFVGFALAAFLLMQRLGRPVSEAANLDAVPRGSGGAEPTRDGAKSESLALEEAPGEIPTRVAAESAALPPAPAPGRTITLFGNVRDAVTDAAIRRDVDLVFTNGEKTRRAELDFGAEYQFMDMEPGTWNVSLTAPGYRSQSNSLVVTDSPKQWLRLRLFGSNTIAVHVVTPDGRSLAEVLSKQSGLLLRPDILVIATAEPPPARTADSSEIDTPLQRIGKMTPWTTGRAATELAAEYGGVLTLPEPQPVFVSAFLSGERIAMAAVAAGAAEATLAIAPSAARDNAGSLRMRVVDAEDDTPLAHMRVRITAAGATNDRTVVGDDGSVSIDGIPASAAIVSIEAEGFELARQKTRVIARQVTDFGTWRIAAGRELQVALVDATDQPVIGMVYAVPLGSFEDGGVRGLSPETKQITSAAVFHGLEPRKYVLHVWATGYVARPVVVDTTASKISRIKLRCVPPTTVDLGPLGEDEQVRVFDLDDLPATGIDGGTQSNGRVFLAPGSYRAEYFHQRTLVRTKRFEVAPIGSGTGKQR